MDRAPETPAKTKPARTAISKGTRFEVFKRDGFVCQYCGAHPPATILHVDHIHPVAEGGTNDQDNLVTACADCNLGKGAKLLSAIPQSLKDKAEEIEEREEQLRGYRAVLDARRGRIDKGLAYVNERWEESFSEGNWYLTDNAVRSMRRFLENLPFPSVYEAMELSCERFPDDRDRAFRYFCGICWKRIRGEDR